MMRACIQQIVINVFQFYNVTYTEIFSIIAYNGCVYCFLV